ncbi:MAG: c-type cytochrome [Verrucomicrobiota bacterium]|jgi:mono/diheme cytochrome c family protein
MSLRLFSLFATLLAHTLCAQDTPGLAVSFSAAGKTDSRVDRLLSLYVPGGQAPTPFLAAGAFTAKWEGDIQSPLRGIFKLGVETSGKFKLSLNGQPLLDGVGLKTVQLNKGANHLVAEITSAEKGDTFVRLNWASKDFPLEPVPPTILTHAVKPELTAASQLREGRLLFAQLNCAACHADAALLPAKGIGMPEFGQNAPLLADLGAKYKPAFLADWIADPHAIRPHTLMPKLFAGADTAQKAADLAAMLTQGTAPATEKPLDPKLASAGGGLFANLGCIACHQRPDATGADAHDRIPLGHVRDKWQAAALIEFLKDPAKNYPATRMPHFRLSDEESAQIATYLLINGMQIKRQAIAGDAARGATLLVSAGCLNCHAGMPATTQPALAKIIKAGEKGCLGADDKTRAAAPDFALSAPQRASLKAFLTTDLASLKQDTAAEFAERQIKNLNCIACHARDGNVSTWTKVDGEAKKLRDALPAKEHVEGEAVPDAPIPPLTWLGEKLQHEWMSKFIAGKIEYKPRTWLIGRMPGFPAHLASGIALGLNHQHGLPQKEADEPAPNAEKIALGEKLLGADGGFNCITCHAVGEQAATAVFEAPAINFVQTVERVRKGYFQRWVMAPIRIDPDTKMPKYADPEGLTQLTDPFDGKGAQQFEAIREYLRTVK